MKLRNLTLMLVLPLLVAAVPASAQSGKARTEGYYKDIFMNGGIGLNAYPDLPAADFLGMSLEQYS